MGGNYENDRVAFCESVPIHLNKEIPMAGCFYHTSLIAFYYLLLGSFMVDIWVTIPALRD